MSNKKRGRKERVLKEKRDEDLEGKDIRKKRERRI